MHARKRPSAACDVQLCVRRGARSQDHPLRDIRTFVDEILRETTRECDALYAQHGHSSILPERLLSAQLPELFYPTRRERDRWTYNATYRLRDQSTGAAPVAVAEAVWIRTARSSAQGLQLLARGSS